MLSACLSQIQTGFRTNCTCCLLAYLLHTDRQENVSPVVLSEGSPPEKFPDGLPNVDDWCYEVDPENKSEDNPHGVGKDFGRIIYPHGDDIKLWWTDKTNDITLKKFLKLCPRVGSIVVYKGLKWKVDSYGEKGCLLVEPPTDKEVNKKASPAVTRKRKQQKKQQKKVRARKSTPPRKRRKTRSQNNKMSEPAKDQGMEPAGKTAKQADKPTAKTVKNTSQPTAKAADKPQKKTNAEKASQQTASRRKKMVSRKKILLDKQQKEQAMEKEEATPAHEGDTDDKPTAGWLRCRNGTPLTNKESKVLTEALNNIDLPPDWAANLFYAFTERTIKEYKTLQKSEIHLNRQKVYKSAISQVMEQVRPASTKPYNGDTSKALVTLMPVLTQVVVSTGS